MGLNNHCDEIYSHYMYLEYVPVLNQRSGTLFHICVSSLASLGKQRASCSHRERWQVANIWQRSHIRLDQRRTPRPC